MEDEAVAAAACGEEKGDDVASFISTDVYYPSTQEARNKKKTQRWAS